MALDRSKAAKNATGFYVPNCEFYKHFPGGFFSVTGKPSETCSMANTFRPRDCLGTENEVRRNSRF